MATADEILKKMDILEAGEDLPVCIIDPETRTITVPPEYQLLGVENDKRVERLYFRCPKVVGDHQDLSQDYYLFINYSNAQNELDAYRIENMEVDGEDIVFSWRLEENVTKYQGTVQFAFGAIIPGTEKGDPDKNRWNTTINKDCYCLVGLKSTQQVAESNPDALAQIWQAIDELKAGEGQGGTGDYASAADLEALRKLVEEHYKVIIGPDSTAIENGTILFCTENGSTQKNFQNAGFTNLHMGEEPPDDATAVWAKVDGMITGDLTVSEEQSADTVFLAKI